MAILVQKAAIKLLPAMPRAAVERVGRRYVAGSGLSDAARVVTELARAGRVATIDVLGEEHTGSAAQVRSQVQQYLKILESFDDQSDPPTLSVRMTAMGLEVDPELPWEHLRHVAAAARDGGRDLTIDMEDSSTVDVTLEHYRRLRSEGFDNVGIVLQSCLRRTMADIDLLAPLAPRVRVVKGIWVEPFSVAHDDFDVIRARYLRMLDRLLGCGSYVEIATHDDWLIDQALSLIDRHGRGTDEYEFQALLGVRPEIGDLLVAEGRVLRVYVPFGQDWYLYCLRRLKENPVILNHVAGDVIRQILRAGAGRRAWTQPSLADRDQERSP